MAKKCSGVTKTVTTAGRKFVLDMDIIIVRQVTLCVARVIYCRYSSVPVPCQYNHTCKNLHKKTLYSCCCKDVLHRGGLNIQRLHIPPAFTLALSSNVLM